MVVKLSSSYFKMLLDAIYTIEQLTDNMSPSDSVEDRKTFLAVLWVLVHIGELVSVLIKHYPDMSITDGKNIVWLRNILAHEYMTIRKSFVRKILAESLAILKQECIHHLTQDNIIHHPHSIEFSD